MHLNSIVAKFTSDGSTSGDGWELDYSCLQCDEGESYNYCSEPSEGQCGGVDAGCGQTCDDECPVCGCV